MFLMLAFKLPLRQLNWAISFSAARMPLPSHWIRNFRFFVPYFGFLPFLGKFQCHWLWAIQIFQCFGSRNPKKFRQTSLYWESSRLFLQFIHQPDRVARKANSDIKHVKKIRFFFTCVVTARNHFYNTLVYMIISFYATMNPLSLIKITTITIHQYQYPRI